MSLKEGSVFNYHLISRKVKMFVSIFFLKMDFYFVNAFFYKNKNLLSF